jgi:aryl-alcohol dehydrogenase-like predicted oxidoreductase
MTDETGIEQRELGRIGRRVSVLGFGSGAGGGLMVRADSDDRVRAVQRAIEAGITYFDTAPGYGGGRSEEYLGRALNALDAWKEVVVGTKVRLTAADYVDPVAAVRRSCEASLERLGHDRVDLLQLHNPVSLTGESTSPTGDDAPLSEVLAGVADGMEAVQRAGLAGGLGFTGLGDTQALHQIARDGRFGAVQGYFNALNPSAGYRGASGGGQDFDSLIDVCADAGVGVLAFRVLAAGALIGQPDRHPLAGAPDAPLDRGPTYEGNTERAKSLAPIVAEFDLESPLELAFRFAQSKDGVSSVLIGFSDLHQLEDAVRWSARGSLPKEAVERIVSLARRHDDQGNKP